MVGGRADDRVRVHSVRRACYYAVAGTEATATVVLRRVGPRNPDRTVVSFTNTSCPRLGVFGWTKTRLPTDSAFAVFTRDAS